ncbi:MAG: T9SS type A sorting domain-containing protein [Bacteroidetes bacterium]|nr:T9SS type A sorting domain-containing protein [Bacteroidota bacterium]
MKNQLIKNFIFSTIILLYACFTSYSQDTIFIQMFDYAGSALPSNWTNNIVAGSGQWQMGVGAGPGSMGMSRLPDSTAIGQQNIYFRRAEANQIARAITPPINTEFAVRPQLSFYHAQYPAGEPGGYLYNRLRVLARVGTSGAWTQLANYNAPNFGWEERFIDIPFNQPNVYIAFEGFQDNPGNNSVCIDAILILDIDSMERVLTNVNTFQASTNSIPTGTDNNPILKTQFRVIGNDGTLELQQFTVRSLNTNDSDIKPGGVKLYFTNQDVFSTDNLLAQGNFVGGEIVFQDIGLNLPTGYSYAWVTYDIELLAGQSNIADAFIPVNGIIVNGDSYPASNQSPLGHRVILQTIFYDNFEDDLGWDLMGEWEIGEPMGLGGGPGGTTEGNADPSFAVIGSRILGTDLTGLGVYPGNYEPNLNPKEYQAIMPEINCYYYTNVAVQFYRWLNVYIFDEATIEISTNGGVEWNVIWHNTSIENQASWNFRTYSIPLANRKESVKLRFTLGNTGTSNLQSGWNIDELIVTGSYVTKDVGIIGWLTPVSNCGLTNQEEVTVVIRNFGAEPSPAEIPIGFSLNGGVTWQYDTYYGVLEPEETAIFALNPKADFSIPGRYNNIIARTFLPGDQDNSNDAFNHKIFSIPTFEMPYSQSFDVNDGLWTAYGTNKSLVRGVPSGTTLSGAYDGSFAWITNPYGKYNSDEFSWVESPCFNFSNIEDPVIEFSIKVDTQYGLDGAAIEYSIDQGLNWIRVVPRSDDLVWNWHGTTNIIALQNTTGNGSGWSGLTEEWQRVRVILPQSLNGEPAVRFRMLFASQSVIPVTNQEGVVFDAVQVYETPYDVGVSAIFEPVSDCSLSSEEQLSIEIKNYGIRTLPAGTIIPAGVDINDNDAVIENFQLISDLEPEATISVFFVNLFDFSEVADYNITAYTLMPGDTDFFNPGFFNDTTSTNITVFGFPEISIWPVDTVYTTQPDLLTFDAGPGFVNYLWQDNSTNQTYSVSSPHTLWYSVTVTDINNCQSSDSVLVYTRNLEVTALEAPLSNCEFFEPEPVKVVITNIGFDPYEIGSKIPIDVYFQTVLNESKTFYLNQPLNPGEDLIFDFNNDVEMMSFGEYLFSIQMNVTDADSDDNINSFNVYSRGYPEIDLGETIYSLQPDTIQLNAGPGMALYNWNDGYDGQIYNVTSNLTQLYWVNITDVYGCSSYDEALIVTYDIEVAGIISPEDECELGSNQKITFRLTSAGLDDFPPTTFEASLTVDGIFYGSQFFNIENPINIGNAIDLEFDFFVNMTAFKTYNVVVEVFNVDANLSNNVLSVDIITHGYPEPYLPPYIITDNPSSVILDPGAGFNSYLWNDNSTNQTLSINDWGVYSVTVTNNFGCEGSVTTIVVPEEWELSFEEIVSPVIVCFNEGLEVELIFKLFNHGPAPLLVGEEIDFFYEIDGAGLIEETFVLSSDFYPNTYKDFLLANTINDVSVGIYNIAAYFDYDNDIDETNNIIQSTFNVYQALSTALPDTIFTSTPIGHVIDAGEGFVSYEWGNGHNGRFYNITSGISQWYYVFVVDVNLCSAYDSVFVLTYDWAITDIISPESNCVIEEQNVFAFKVKNIGYDTFEQGFLVNFSYSFNDNDFIEKIVELQNDLLPNGEITVEFEELLDITSIGEYSLVAKFDLIDVYQSNNIKEFIVEHTGWPQINLGPDILTNRPDTVALDAGAGFASYLWHNGYTGQVFDVSNFGLHWVEVLDVYNCDARDEVLISPATNVVDVDNKECNIFPNPANDFINIQCLNLDEKKFEVQVLDLTGKLLISQKTTPTPNYELKIFIGELKEGAYFIRIIGENEFYIYKFAKIENKKSVRK